MIEKYIDFFRKGKIGEPPWEYDFLFHLPESEYPKYLAKIFNYRTGEKLPLKFDLKNKTWIIDKNQCKTFNQKIQWIKLYGVTDVMRKCTDKVAVRDYVAEKIGSEYLKPVLQMIPQIQQSDAENLSPLRGKCHEVTKGGIKEVVYDSEDLKNNKENIYTPIQHTLSVANEPPYPAKAVLSPHGGQMSKDSCRDVTTYFDQIDFDKLPNAFVIKCSHGCKWFYIIKNQEEYINTKSLFYLTRNNITNWLKQEYWCWNGFELQYKKIVPKILIEPLLRDNINVPSQQIQVYCFSGIPEVIVRVYNEHEISVYDKNLKITDDIFNFKEQKININTDNLINQSFDLSAKLSKDISFVRVDWMLFQNKLYFEEMTFTPYSGFYQFDKIKNNIYLGKLIKED